MPLLELENEQGGSLHQDGQSQWQQFDGDRVDSGSGGAPVYALSQNAVDNMTAMRQDAGRSAFPYGDLTHVLDKVLLQRHQPLTAMKHFPINREAGWAEFFELYTMNDFGDAKIVCCSDDFPRVQIDGCTWRSGFVTLGTGYRICYDTLKAQEVSKRRINYEANLLRVAIRSIREKANKLAYQGSMAHSILGICNNPFVPTLTSPYPLDNSTSPQDILAVLSEAACQSYVASGMTSMLPDAVIAPPSIMRGLMKRLMSSTGDSPASIAQQWALFAPNLTYFGEAPELENAGPNGERVMFFYRRDPQCIEWHFPVSIEVVPQYWNGYEYEQNIVARVGSVFPYYPQDCLKLVGV